MDDEKRIINALNKLADIEKQNRLKKEEERKYQEEAAKKRKRLHEFFYEQASPMSFIVPEGSSLLEMDDK